MKKNEPYISGRGITLYREVGTGKPLSICCKETLYAKRIDPATLIIYCGECSQIMQDDGTGSGTYLNEDPKSISDRSLLKAYKLGWNAASNDLRKICFYYPLMQRAFDIGYSDFIAGDDVKSIDLQSDEDIIKHIRNN